MKTRLDASHRGRLHLSCLVALALAACGGAGGGGATDAAVPPASGGGTSAPPGPGEPAGVSAVRWGPLVLETHVGPTARSSVARLDTGASVVAWVKDGALQAQRLDASGSKQGDVFRISGNVRFTDRFSIAPLNNGDWLAIWVANGSAGGTIQFQRYNEAGAAIGRLSGVSDTDDQSPAPVARGTADGGVVIGWVTASRAFVTRIDRSGGALSSAPVSSDQLGEQDELSFSPRPDGNVVVAWRQLDDLIVGGPARSLGYTRLLDARGLPVGSDRAIVASVGLGLPAGVFSSAPLPDDRMAVAWASGGRLNWQILDPAGGPVTDSVLMQSGEQELTQLTVVEAGGGSFDLLFQLTGRTSEATSSTIMVQRVNASGMAEGPPSTAVPARRTAGFTAGGLRAPPASEHFSVSGSGDGHYVISYQVSTDVSAQVEVLAR